MTDVAALIEWHKDQARIASAKLWPEQSLKHQQTADALTRLGEEQAACWRPANDIRELRARAEKAEAALAEVRADRAMAAQVRIDDFRKLKAELATRDKRIAGLTNAHRHWRNSRSGAGMSCFIGRGEQERAFAEIDRKFAEAVSALLGDSHD